MASAQSLQLEIQNLKDALSASEKKADRYAQIIATLTVELDDLRNSICSSCKTKLTSGNASVPPTTTSAGQGSIGAASVSAPIPSHPLAATPNTNKPLPVPPDPGVVNDLSSSQSTPTPTHPGPNEDVVSPEEKPNHPKWSVVYHPEVDQALDLHLPRTFTHDRPVHCINMSPDGQRLAVGGNGPTYIYELETGSIINVLVDRYVKDYIAMWSIQFSPNGQLLATVATDGQIRIWDITMKRMRAMFKGDKSGVYGVVFSPNGRSLASASFDQSVQIWNIHDGSSKVLGSGNEFFSLAFSPDGRYVAAGDYKDSLWIWDSRTHTLVAKWRGHTNSVLCIGFTPDGNGLVSGGLDNMVKYWDTRLLGNRQGLSSGTIGNGEQCFPEMQTFLGHSAGIRSIAFFPHNSQWIVTCSNDRSVRVWDAGCGVCQLTIQGHMNSVRGVDVSRIQNFLVTAGHDGHVSVWKYELL